MYLRLLMVVLLSVSSLSVAKIHAATRGSYDLSASARMAWLVCFIGLAVFLAYAFGLPEKPVFSSKVRTSFIASILPAVGFALIQTALGEFLLPRMYLALSVPVNTVLLTILVWSSRAMMRSSSQYAKVCLLASSETVHRIERDLSAGTEVLAEIVIKVQTHEEIQQKDLLQRCENEAISVVVVLEELLGRDDVAQFIAAAQEHNLKIRTVTGFYDNYIGKLPVDIGEQVVPCDVAEAHSVLYARSSRALDLFIGVVGLVFLAFAIPFVAVGNLIANRGPLFYRQERIGKGGRNFQILKFRSMKSGGVSSEWTTDEDQRITPFGRIIRLSHIDELPQFLNILVGDLSLVGPRPEQSTYVEQLRKSIPRYDERHLVRPGLTGWAQVNYPYGASEKDALEKLQYDLWYVKHQRLWVDAKVIARTVRHVIGLGGR